MATFSLSMALMLEFYYANYMDTNSQKLVWWTRPEPPNKSTNDHYHHDPLMIYLPTSTPISPREYDIFVTTSQRAIKELSCHEDTKSKTLYCVGNSSANYAQSLGFREIVVGEGTAASLIPKLQSKGVGKKILFLRGDVIHTDLKAILKDMLFIDSQIAYRTQLAKAFASQTLKLWERGQIYQITFFSLRCAQRFKELYRSLPTPLPLPETVCLSQRIAEGIQDLEWKNTIIV